MSFKLSYYPRLCALIALTITSCLPANQVGPRPATNPATVVEAYLQKYQPGPLPRLFQTTYLYDRNGALLAEVFPEGRRTWVSLSAVSPDLIHATVATEDASFYSNGGIDFRRIAGAVLEKTGAQGVAQVYFSKPAERQRQWEQERQGQRYRQRLISLKPSVRPPRL